jgi:hypothetical protein
MALFGLDFRLSLILMNNGAVLDALESKMEGEKGKDSPEKREVRCVIVKVIVAIADRSSTVFIAPAAAAALAATSMHARGEVRAEVRAGGYP